VTEPTTKNKEEEKWKKKCDPIQLYTLHIIVKKRFRNNSYHKMVSMVSGVVCHASRTPDPQSFAVGD